MSDRIESRLQENRRFPPPEGFVKHARIGSHPAYSAMYQQSIEEPEVFWREQTCDLVWREPWKKPRYGSKPTVHTAAKQSFVSRA